MENLDQNQAEGQAPRTVAAFRDAAGKPNKFEIIGKAMQQLEVEHSALLEALRLVTSSGPLNNGLTDENTMAIARAAIAKATGGQA